MNTTVAKVYAAIAGIPLAAILLAGAISGGSQSSLYDANEADLQAALSNRSASAGSGTSMSEAEAYKSLGKYNPCIFIQCEGE